MPVYAAAVPNWVHVPQDAHVLRGDLDAVCVIDGLGGHPGSEHAAHAAAAAVAGCPDAEHWPHAALQAAQQAVLAARAAAPPEHRTMTCAALAARRTDDGVQVAWSGDCRLHGAWTTDAGHAWLRILTDDHDFLSQQGRIAPDSRQALRLRLMDAQTASDAFRIGGSIGKKAFKKAHLMWAELASGPISVATVAVPDGATLIASTDGVHDNVTAARMRELCATCPPDQLADELVGAAEHVAREGVGRGHVDDITCAVIGP